MASSSRTPYFTGPLYDALKFIALILLPALATLYFALAQIWGLPRVTEIVGTITSVDTFLGVVLRLSTSAYNKSDAKYDGIMHVTETAEKINANMELNEDAADLTNKSQVLFKVNRYES